MRNYLVLGMLIVTLVIVAMQSFQISAIKGQITGNAVAGGAVDMTGWTEDERMNYDMHGIIPARVKGSAASSAAPQMVGGC